MKGWITWGELLVYLALGAMIYYGYLLFVYYRRQLNKRSADQRPVKWKREEENPIIVKETTSSNQSSDVHELMQELKEVFGAAVRDQLNKDQIIEALKNKLIQYPSVAQSNFREAIHQHIISEVSLQLKINISPAELSSLW